MSAVRELTPELYTAEDLLRLKQGGVRHELVRGVLREMPLPGARHGQMTIRLSASAALFVEEHALGECFTAETGFRIERSPDTVRGGDWAFVRRERLPEVIADGYLDLAPDIVLEVRSPHDQPRDVREKVDLWLRCGSEVVWDLDPRGGTLTVHRRGHGPLVLGPDETLTCEDLLPGFAIAVRRLFR